MILELLDLLDVWRHAQDTQLGQLGRTKKSMGLLLLLWHLLLGIFDLVYVTACDDAMVLDI